MLYSFSDLKVLFAIIGGIFAVLAYIPYLKGMFAGNTRPHLYTWLIWSITNGTATAGLWYGGGGWGAVSQTISAFLTFAFLILSFRYGTKNITRSDSAVLLLALSAIFIWWLLQSPLLAVLMVTVIDAFGYLPTFRKSFEEPWSEPILTWVMFTFAVVFGLLALSSYNPITVTYLLMSAIANAFLVSICIVRRRMTPRPV